MVAVQVVVAGISAAIVYHQTLADTETINSTIYKKQQERVSCSHSYSCNCRTVSSGSGKHKTTSRKCDTCYEHTNDWDWAVYTTLGQRMEISRVDRRGSNEPERFTQVQLGEPASTTSSYDNYVKAAPDTLFRRQGQVEKYQQYLPEYPQQVFDYYRMNRLVVVNGATVEDNRYWNADLSVLNAEMGRLKQTNVVLVFAKGLPAEYFYALEQHWVGGKKNDVILVIGLDSSGNKSWVNVMAWENNDLFKVKLRDAVLDLPDLQRWSVLPVLKEHVVKYHDRKPMKDFEYLTASITPTVTQWTVTLIIQMLICLALTVFLHKNEIFPEYRNY